MAQTVEYTLKLNIDGQDHVVNLSSDVKQLAEDLGVTKEGSDEQTFIKSEKEEFLTTIFSES